MQCDKKNKLMITLDMQGNKPKRKKHRFFHLGFNIIIIIIIGGILTL